MKDELPKFRVRRVRPNPAPVAKTGAAPAQPRADSAPAGRVQFDERGNAVWKWGERNGQADRSSATQPLKMLENPTLSLADDAPTPSEIVRPNPLGMVKGYDPYDSGKLDRKKKGRPVKKDLRKLSEWIKLRKQAADNDPLEE
jgi:hypothetical protein